MKPHRLALLGLGLSTASFAQAPSAESRTATVSEAGPAVSGNVLTDVETVAQYSFDNPGFDEGTLLQNWTDTVGTSFPSRQVFNNNAFAGGRATGGFANGSGNQDSSHPTLVLTSPSFDLSSPIVIRFGLAGGAGAAAAPAADLASIPAASGNGGFQGLALRRLSDDAYVAWARRSGNNAAYETQTFNWQALAAIEAANPADTYVLDYIDYYHGGWGFGGVDDVTIFGVSESEVAVDNPPTVTAGAAAYGSDVPSATNPAGTLNDGFLYNPVTPTNPMPDTGFNGPDGFHNNSGNGPATLLYVLGSPILDGASNQIAVDLYGRNANQDRDNDVDIAFLDASDVVLGEVLGAAIPDGGTPHLRVTSTAAGVTDGSSIAKIRITGNDSDGTPATTNNFTLMEMRVANLQADFDHLTDTVTVTEVEGSAANVGNPVTLASGAEVTINADGSYTYDPNGAIAVAGAPVLDPVGFTIGYGGTDTSNTLTVSVVDADAVFYVDGAWAGLASGDPIADADAGTTGAQPATFGTDAFATISEALFAAHVGSTVVLNDGAYAEDIGLVGERRLRVTGTDAAQTVEIDLVVGAAGTSIEVQGTSVLLLAEPDLDSDLSLAAGSVFAPGPGNVAGVISGDGAVAVDPAGSLSLSGANTYTGGTTIVSGRAQADSLQAFGTGDVTVQPSGQAFLVSTAGAFANNFTLEGQGWTEGAGDLGALRFNTGTEVAGDITIAAAGARVVCYNGAAATLSGDLLGSGNLEFNYEANATANGTLSFTGDASTFTGEFYVANGTLVSDSTFGADLYVGDSGTLSGSGTVNGTLTFGTTGGATLIRDPDGGSGFSAADVVLNGTTTVDFVSLPDTFTPFALFDYTGTIDDGGDGVSNNFVMANAGSYRLPVFSDNAMTIEVSLSGKTLTFVGTTPDWDINSSVNWTDGINPERFYNGDAVIFDDTVSGGFAGVVNITGTPVPSAITVNNSTGDYEIVGEFSGDAALTKSGTGVLTLTPPDEDMPYTGLITINGGRVELGTDDGALRNASVRVNAGGTFAYLAGNADNDTETDFELAGGTLEFNESMAIWPAGNPITLVTGTTSTVTVNAGTVNTALSTIVGDGSLIKSGAGTLQFQSAEPVTYTGSTTVEEGLLQVDGDVATQSDDWTVEGGTLRLGNDSGAPIANLPPASTVVMTDGTFDYSGNVETVAGLTMDSTTGTPTLFVNPASSDLTVDVLTLTGTDNLVRFSTLTGTGPFPVITYNSTLTGTAGVNLRLDNDFLRPGSWADNAGTLEVTLLPLATEWTGATSAFWEVGGLDNNWTTAPGFYFNFDTVTFGDTGAGAITIDDLENDPILPGGIVFNNTAGNDYTFTGQSIGGAGSLTKNGDGIVELNNTQNTFTGGVAVNDGTLALGTGGGTGAVRGVVTVTGDGSPSSSVLRLDVNNAMGYTGGQKVNELNLFDGAFVDNLGAQDNGWNYVLNMRGSAMLSSAPDGRFSFGGPGGGTGSEINVLASATTSEIGGAITIRENNPGNQLPIDVEDGAAATDFLLSANVNENRGFVKTGAGRMELTGRKTGTGPIRVSGGTLAAIGTGSLSFDGYDGASVITVDSGAVLELDDWQYYEGNATQTSLGGLRNNANAIVIDNGTIRMNGVGDCAYDRGFTINAGGATLEANGANRWVLEVGTALVLNGNPNLLLTGSGTGQIDKAYFGAGGITKTGSGTWFLNGANTYTGPTVVSDGALGGTGSVTSDVTVAAGASLEPGASVGSFDITGNLDISALAGGAGTLDFELDAIGASDQITVTGTTTIGSGLLGFSDFVFTDLGGLENGTYTLISSGSLSGSLDGGNLSGPIGGATATLQVTGSDIELVVTGALSPFEDWIENTVFANPGVLASPADKLPGADPDGDGIDNIGEYGFDGDPTDGANNGKVFLVIADGDDNPDTDPDLILTVAVRSTVVFTGGAPATGSADGVDYSIEGSLDLSSFTETVNVESVAIPPAGAPTPNAGWEYRSFSLDGSSGLPDKGFLRARAEETP
ncbi:hypothetical protein HAHE_20650 [Haloferula helveola]|uniref:Uncharacterized protein n=1 Tax=Haloferula helveola TaxID=490095 RepID=A0ABN6H6A1_9BACT|nr:hypothetical protein HAHE_20650 [Haloferula helveola]